MQENPTSPTITPLPTLHVHVSSHVKPLDPRTPFQLIVLAPCFCNFNTFLAEVLAETDCGACSWTGLTVAGRPSAPNISSQRAGCAIDTRILLMHETVCGKPTVPTVHHQDAEPLIPNLVRATGVSRGDLTSAVTVDLVSKWDFEGTKGPTQQCEAQDSTGMCGFSGSQSSSVDPSLQETLARRGLHTRLRRALYLKRIWQVSIACRTVVLFQSTHAASYKYLTSKLTR